MILACIKSTDTNTAIFDTSLVPQTNGHIMPDVVSFEHLGLGQKYSAGLCSAFFFFKSVVKSPLSYVPWCSFYSGTNGVLLLVFFFFLMALFGVCMR